MICLAYSHSILNIAAKEMLLKFKSDHLSPLHKLPLAVHLIQIKIQSPFGGLQDPMLSASCYPLLLCHWQSLPRITYSHVLSLNVVVDPKGIVLEAVSTL